MRLWSSNFWPYIIPFFPVRGCSSVKLTINYLIRLSVVEQCWAVISRWNCGQLCALKSSKLKSAGPKKCWPCLQNLYASGHKHYITENLLPKRDGSWVWLKHSRTHRKWFIIISQSLKTASLGPTLIQTWRYYIHCKRSLAINDRLENPGITGKDNHN